MQMAITFLAVVGGLVFLARQAVQVKSEQRR